MRERERERERERDEYTACLDLKISGGGVEGQTGSRGSKRVKGENE
jgi:hypothetical protein